MFPGYRSNVIGSDGIQFHVRMITLTVAVTWSALKKFLQMSELFLC